MNGFFRDRTAASCRIMVLFIDCEIVHAWHICVCCGVGLRLGSLSAQIECSNESSRQDTANESASHARRTTGLVETAGAGRWVSSESAPTENPRHFHYLEQGYLQETSPRFDNMCITAVLLYQCRHRRRPLWEERKVRDSDHSTRTLTKTLIRMLWGKQCSDTVACEGSRLIRPVWLLCCERILSRSCRLGMLWMEKY